MDTPDTSCATLDPSLVRRVGDGYTIPVTVQYQDCPVALRLATAHVAPDGSVTIEGGKKLSPSNVCI